MLGEREKKKKREGPRLRTALHDGGQGDEEGRASETEDTGVRWGEYPERRVDAREGGAHRSTGRRRNTLLDLNPLIVSTA